METLRSTSSSHNQGDDRGLSVPVTGWTSTVGSGVMVGLGPGVCVGALVGVPVAIGVTAPATRSTGISSSWTS